jgi:hypothetical protein
MDISAWKSAWGIFMNDPVPFTAAVVILMGLVWWVRGFIGSERIATLEERLRLAADEQKAVMRDVERLKSELNQIKQEIGSHPTIDRLVEDLTTSTGALGITLRPVPGTVDIRATRKSDE